MNKKPQDRKAPKKRKKSTAPKYTIVGGSSEHANDLSANLNDYWKTHIDEDKFYNEGDSDLQSWKFGNAIPDLNVKIGELVFVKTKRNNDIFSGHFSTSKITIAPSAQWGLWHNGPNSGLSFPVGNNASQIIGTSPVVGTTTIPRTAINPGISVSGQQTAVGTGIKLGMTAGISPGNAGMPAISYGQSASPQITFSSSYSVSTTYTSSGSLSLSLGGTISKSWPQEDYVAMGFKTVDDLLNYKNTVSVKQEETWTDEEKKEMAIKLHDSHWEGKPFIGIVVDKYTPTTKTEKGEVVGTTMSNKSLYSAYKILFDEHHCFWFRELDIYPVHREKENIK